MITETKLNKNFSVGQFFINGFSSPFRLDRDRNGGGIFYTIEEIYSLTNMINKYVTRILKYHAVLI